MYPMLETTPFGLFLVKNVDMSQAQDKWIQFWILNIRGTEDIIR